MNPYPPIGTTDGLRDPDGNPFPSIENLLAGEMPDGSLPKLHSRALYGGWDKPLPGDPGSEPFAREIADLLKHADLHSLDVAGEAISFQREMIHHGRAVLRGAETPFKPEVVLRLAESASRSVVRNVKTWREIMIEGAARAAELDQRRAFMESRAVGVVLNTLLGMEQKFIDVGFGAWMPFRFPDQWLMFCGVMQKVLAANGLIHAKNPDVYRRLLEETPPVESDGFDVAGKLPQNWARCWTNRGASTMAELHARLTDEVWFPPHPRAP